MKATATLRLTHPPRPHPFAGRLAAAILLSGLLSAGAACSRKAAPAAPVQTEILWDNWGVPHIFARNPNELFYSFGWAQMHSHGNLLLHLYGLARGRAAEYWGPDFLESDRLVRRLGVPGRAKEWLKEQDPEMQEYLRQFVRGINAYAERHANEIKPENRRVLPVEATDILAHQQRVINFVFMGGRNIYAAERWQGNRSFSLFGSNGWAIAPSDATSGHAMLLANPHLPWSGLFTWFEAHLAAPGVDGYGATLVGLPILAVAFNQHLGWTHTVNPMDAADLYRLTLKKGGYAWEGGVRPFEVQEEVVKVRQKDGSEAEERLEIRRSIQGPVIAQKNGQALAIRVSGLQQPGILRQYWDMLRASTFAQFQEAEEALQMPFFNTIYADDQGHIFYLFGGRVPLRPKGDWKFWQGVVPGDTAATLWSDTIPYKDLPKVLDPPSGWLQNSNDPPWSCTFPELLRPRDFPAYLAPVRLAFRPQRGIRMLRDGGKISFDQLMLDKLSTRSELADRILEELVREARKRGGQLARDGAEVLEKWDRSTEKESRGAVLFKQWWQEMNSGRSPVFRTPWSAKRPLQTPSGLADPARAVKALERAARRVKKDYGSLDVAWGDVYRLRVAGQDLAANGGPGSLGIFRVVDFAPDAGSEAHLYHATGGDSFVALVEFSNPVRARVLLTYGNSSRPGSRHYGDQLKLFAGKQLRAAWLTRRQVEAHLEQKEVMAPAP